MAAEMKPQALPSWMPGDLGMRQCISANPSKAACDPHQMADANGEKRLFLPQYQPISNHPRGDHHGRAKLNDLRSLLPEPCLA